MANVRRRAGRFGKGKAYADDKKNVLRKLESLKKSEGIKLDDHEYTIMKCLPPHALMEVCKRWINLIEHNQATLPLGVALRQKGLRQAKAAAIGLGREYVTWFELKAKICDTPIKQNGHSCLMQNENESLRPPEVQLDVNEHSNNS
ncbi:hypothetical protein FOL47_002733, partial [Perkinsus chesapeaki]